VVAKCFFHRRRWRSWSEQIPDDRTYDRDQQPHGRTPLWSVVSLDQHADEMTDHASPYFERLPRPPPLFDGRPARASRMRAKAVVSAVFGWYLHAAKQSDK
jgi:hypothetical protein